jgi:cell division protein FtsX
MSIFDKVSDWLNGVYGTFGKFVSENWKTYYAALAVVTAGGFLGHFFGWPFSLFVPGWFVFVGWIFKRKYENR